MHLDLLTEYKAATYNTPIKTEWVKRHQDKGIEWNNIDELKGLKLSNTATLNLWCDHQAVKTCIQGWSDPVEDVYPSEKWAVFSETPILTKITGPLIYNIIHTLSHGDLENIYTKSTGYVMLNLMT